MVAPRPSLLGLSPFFHSYSLQSILHYATRVKKEGHILKHIKQSHSPAPGLSQLMQDKIPNLVYKASTTGPLPVL